MLEGVPESMEPKLPDLFIPRVLPFMMALLVVDSFASRSSMSSFLNFQTIVYSYLAGDCAVLQ